MVECRVVKWVTFATRVHFRLVFKARLAKNMGLWV